MTDDRSPLARSYRVSHDVVHGKLDELRALLAAPLALGAHIGESPLDVRDLERPQPVFEIEMLRDQGFDLAANGGMCALGYGAGRGLLCACGCLEFKLLFVEPVA